MVVLMDPMEDPDDILRAHRSREKSYLFDVAFDFTATQVREGLGLGTRRSPSLTFAALRRELAGDTATDTQPSLHHSLSGFPLCCTHRLPCGGARVTHTQSPMWAHPAGGPLGSRRKAPEAHLAQGGLSGKLTPSLGPPSRLSAGCSQEQV